MTDNQKGPSADELLRPSDCLQAWESTIEPGFTLRGWMTPATGKPVIHFVHGNGYCGLVYWPMLAGLLADYDLFLHDAQGHGDSDVGGRFRGWNKTADLVAQVWREQGAPWAKVPRIAMGHSFGGVVTSLMLARSPELFDRAVLLDPVLFTPAMIGVMALSELLGLTQINGLAKRAKKRRAHWSSRDEAWQYFYHRGMFKNWDDRCLAAYIDHALTHGDDGLHLKCPPSREAEIFSSFPKRLWPNLAKITAPSTVLYGECSYPFVPVSAKRLARLNPVVSTIAMPGRHCFMQEDPAATAARVLAVLRGAVDECELRKASLLRRH